MGEDANVSNYLMWAGFGIFGWLWLRGRLGRKKRAAELKINALKFNGSAKLKPNQFDGTQSLGAPPEVLKWQVELHELGRQLKGELDSKLLAVQHVNRRIDAATQRLGELLRLAEELDGGTLNAAQRVSSDYSKIQHLAAAGWPADRIAQAMGYSTAEITILLDAQTKTKSEAEV